MPSLAEMLMGYLPSGASPVFGTATPQEQAMVPPTGLDRVVGGAINSMATLPQRAIQNSQFSLGTGTYDPSTSLEAAAMTMGASPFGSGIEGTSPVFGAGPIKAYHGSPHDFDAFDLSKIGTGEGAQAYGHGLYFAENPSVAKSYRDTLADNVTIGGQNYDMYNPMHAATAQVEESGSRAQAIKDISQAVERDPGDPSGHFPNVLRILKSDKELPEYKSSGKMYEVNINADPAHFLDWDKPLSQQPEAAKLVYEAQKKLPTGEDMPYEQWVKEAGRMMDQSGQHWAPSTPSGAQTYSQAGIPGIKYLDQGSRQIDYHSMMEGEKFFAADADKAKKAGPFDSREDAWRWINAEKERLATRNYVLFNDKLIDILRKYGLAGAAATGAMSSPAFGPQQPNLTAQALMEGS